MPLYARSSVDFDLINARLMSCTVAFELTAQCKTSSARAPAWKTAMKVHAREPGGAAREELGGPLVPARRCDTCCIHAAEETVAGADARISLMQAPRLHRSGCCA